MASASDPPAHPALQPADRLILPPLPPRAAVETSIGPPHYPAESTQSHAFVQPSLRARKGHANSDSLFVSWSFGLHLMRRPTPLFHPKKGGAIRAFHNNRQLRGPRLRTTSSCLCFVHNL